MEFKTNNVNETELVYSLLREKYPNNQIEIEYNDNTKEYLLTLTDKTFVEDPEVPIDLNVKVIYGDSLTGDSPLLLKKDGTIYIETIQSIFDENKKVEYPGFKMFDKTIRLEKEYSLTDYQIWTDLGWINIKKVIRHKCEKQIYKILTHAGCIKVTEDHSLLNENKDPIKPTECNLDTKLLSNYPTEFSETCDTISKDRAFIYGFFYGDGSAGFYECKSGDKFSWALNNTDMNVLSNLKNLLQKEYPNSKPIIYDTLESSGVYKLSMNNPKNMVEEFRHKFYDSDRYKKVPTEILNSNNKIIQSFFDGYKLSSDFKNNFTEYEDDEEEWKVIEEFPQYLASSLGNIKHKETNQLRALKANNGGYITISINNKDNIRKTVKVHRLIADTFLNNIENKETVNHKNHNKTDNRVINLEWATTKEQNNHKNHNNLYTNNNKKVLQYDLDGNFIKEYNSIKEIGRIFNKNPADISKICNNVKGKKTFSEYIWKFKEDEILENEIWKSINIDNHIFNVSNFGRVKSKNNIISYGSTSSNGYMRVTSQKDKVSKTMYIHRLVAATFIENKLNNKDQVVNHMDGNKQNNNVNNLEWITYQENSKHSFDLKQAETEADGGRKDKEKIGCTRFDNKGQIGSAGLYYLMKKLGYNVSLNTRSDKEKMLRITITKKKQRKINNKIKKIELQGLTNDYVYDIETEIGRFQGGVGDIICKNTDSVFLRFKFNREDFNLNRKDTFKLASVCGENITDMFNRQPICLEFEKVFHPFILLTKKRYIGKKYEDTRDPFKLKTITNSGVAITRRDFSKVVKNCYKEIIDCMVDDSNSNSAQEAIEIYKKYIDQLDAYQIDIDDLITSKTLAKSYSCSLCKKKSEWIHLKCEEKKGTSTCGAESPLNSSVCIKCKKPFKCIHKFNLVHVQLAIKMLNRKDEANINDRIPFIFIESEDRTLAKNELGEDPEYVKNHNLKYNRSFYLESLGKTLLAFFRIVLNDHQDLLNEAIEYTNDKFQSYGHKGLKPSDFKLDNQKGEDQDE